MDEVRAAALTALYDIDKNGAYMTQRLDELIREKRFEKRDSAFMCELCRGTVRHRGRIDHAIETYSSVKMKKISPWILNILRMGIYQLCFLDKVPESAAVNESVKLARRFGHASSAGFVNALLHRVASAGLPPLPKEETARLSAEYSYPAWIVRRFCDLFGKERAEALLSAGNEVPDLVIRTNCTKITPQALAERLGDAVKKQSGYMLHIGAGYRATELPGFAEGLFTVQAEPFEKAAELLCPEAGMTVLDGCAAPGGKTTAVAERMGDVGTVYAMDIYEHKLKKIEEASNRLGLHIIKTSLHDATAPLGELTGACDRVLADVPCSCLGILRRQPDIKWHRQEEDFASLQYAILENLSTALKSGGILVYATCSIDRAENEDVVCRFIREHEEFTFLPFDGMPYRTWYPDTDGTDGAFICRIKKR